MSNKIHGSELDKEVVGSDLIKDVNSPFQKFIAFLKTKQGLAVTLPAIFMFSAFYSGMWELGFIASLIVLLIARNQRLMLPFRMPKTSNVKDYNDPEPGSFKPQTASGIAYFGNEKKTNNELWFNNGDMRTHIILFGSTGAGKALRNNELIHTPYGWIKNENLKVGDYVTTPEGASKVEGVYPQGQMPLYRISFEDDRSIMVTGDHLWQIAQYDRNNNVLEYHQLNTCQIQDKINNESIDNQSIVQKWKQNQFKNDSDNKTNNNSNNEFFSTYTQLGVPIFDSINSNNHSKSIDDNQLSIMNNIKYWLRNDNNSTFNIQTINDLRTIDNLDYEYKKLVAYACIKKWHQSEQNIETIVSFDNIFSNCKSQGNSLQESSIDDNFKDNNVEDDKLNDEFKLNDELNKLNKQSTFELKNSVVLNIENINHNSKNYNDLNIDPVEQIKQLFYSLGCKIVSNDNNGNQNNYNSKQLTIMPGENYLAITKIEKTSQFEECQCIKIENNNKDQKNNGLFVTKDYIVTHNTETLVSLAYNSLVHGSGFVYVDGKGDSGLWEKIFAMSRSMGREDDLLVINYMTGSRDVYGPQRNKLSNTINPFAAGSSGALTELLVSLMDDAGGGGDMWKGRAISLISAVILGLVDLRDRKEILLDVDTIREYLILENIIKLSQRQDLPSHAIQALKAYLTSLPGYQEGMTKQGETTLEQHGYLQMQFTKILGSLADNYGYIFRTSLGEVDFWDVVVNRRILVVLLPALEKSPEELSNLGKIIVASLKQMMASGLGAELEGSKKEIIDTKPTKAPTPFLCILDEYGYYAVKGAAVMPAQARGIGFSMVFAGQDYPALEKSSKEEAASTLGNCNIKIFMKLEDPEKTFDIASKSGGEAKVLTKSNEQTRTTALGGKKLQNPDSYNYEKQQRVNLLDLKKQREGEAHILFQDYIVRANMFFANPKPSSHMRLNHFLPVKAPEKEDIMHVEEGINNLVYKLEEGNIAFPKEEVEIFELDVIEYIFKNDLFKKQNVLKKTASALYTLNQVCMAPIDNFKDRVRDLLVDDNDEPNINVFSKDVEDEIEKYKERFPYYNDDDDEDDDNTDLSDSDEDNNEQDEDDDDLLTEMDEDEEQEIGLLNEEEVSNNFQAIDNQYAESQEQANDQTEQLLEDMKNASAYPANGVPDSQSVDEIMNIIKELNDDLEEENDQDLYS